MRTWDIDGREPLVALLLAWCHFDPSVLSQNFDLALRMNLFVTDGDAREVKIFDVLSSSSHHPAVRNGQWLRLENRHACGKARLVVDGYAQRPLSLWTWLIVAESVLCDRMTLESRVRKHVARHRVVGVAVVTIFIGV